MNTLERAVGSRKSSRRCSPWVFVGGKLANISGVNALLSGNFFDWFAWLVCGLFQNARIRKLGNVHRKNFKLSDKPVLFKEKQKENL